MAETKKVTAKVDTAAPVKEAEVKEEVKKAAAPAAEVKATVKKTPGRKPAAKKATAEKKAAAEKKAPAKKAAAEKKAPAKRAAKVKEAVSFQFSGKSYTSEDLLKICKDVWKYDLNGKEEDLKSVELYVKPEENTTYYVINGDVTGSFFI